MVDTNRMTVPGIKRPTSLAEVAGEQPPQPEKVAAVEVKQPIVTGKKKRPVTVQTNFRLPEDLYQALRRWSFETETPMVDLVEQAARQACEAAGFLAKTPE